MTSGDPSIWILTRGSFFPTWSVGRSIEVGGRSFLILIVFSSFVASPQEAPTPEAGVEENAIPALGRKPLTRDPLWCCNRRVDFNP